MQATTFKARRLNTQSSHAGFVSAFHDSWPEYKSWYTAKIKDAADPAQLRNAQKQLVKIMPELVPVYETLCELMGDCPVAARFLSGYQPPAYLVSCSQAVFGYEEPILIRNYDLNPAQSENRISHSQWLEKKVMGTNECLWGLDDGINDAGLAASLTFGGSNKVGQGFGIPFIMRYVLETCESVQQAIRVLERVPSHMAYNVTLLDKQGDFATVMLVPNGAAIVTRERCITNHQQHVTWPEQAAFSKTLERKRYLDQLLSDPQLDKHALRAAFLSQPLHSTNYAQQFGTVYTAVYQPTQGTLAYHWPNQQPLRQQIDNFAEQDRVVDLAAIRTVAPVALALKTVARQTVESLPETDSNHAYDEWAWEINSQQGIPTHLRQALLDGFDYLPLSSDHNGGVLQDLINGLKSREDFSWEEYGRRMGDLWSHGRAGKAETAVGEMVGKQ